MSWCKMFAMVCYLMVLAIATHAGHNSKSWQGGPPQAPGWCSQPMPSIGPRAVERSASLPGCLAAWLPPTPLGLSPACLAWRQKARPDMQNLSKPDACRHIRTYNILNAMFAQGSTCICQPNVGLSVMRYFLHYKYTHIYIYIDICIYMSMNMLT